MSIKEESQEHSTCNNPENHQVHVYLRLANSKSVKIVLSVEEEVLSIKKKVMELFGIEPKKQILYYKGKELFKNKILTLNDKAIIHVKTIEEEENNHITVNIIKHCPQQINHFKLNSISIPVSINPEQTIESFLKQFLQDTNQNIDIKRTKIIECGRFLKIHKTFLQQKIQSQTQIHLILRKPKKQYDLETNEENKILIQSVLKKSRKNSLCLSDRQHKLSIQDENLDQYPTGELQHRNSQNFYQIQTEQIRRSLPTYFNPTKSSGFWQSQKVIRKELTPLKFSFRDYKKYDGPRSMRDCNCKRKDEFYKHSEGCIKTEGDQSPQECSPLKQKVRKLKKLNTMM